MTEVAVVGAGLMGHALALVFALGGHQVRLTDSNAETLERAPGLMAAALATLTEAGEVDAAIMCLEIAAWHAPGRYETYRFMYELLVKVGRIDQAYSCAAGLVMLGEAELDEDGAHDRRMFLFLGQASPEPFLGSWWRVRFLQSACIQEG